EIPAVGRIEGVVRNAAGGIALGAQVVMNNAVTTTVDNNGFYFFDAVPKGTVSVLAVAAVGPDAGRTSGEVAFDGDVEHLDVQFVGTGAVTGTVLKAGTPVDFAGVTVTGRNALGRPQSVTTQTDAAGRFQAGTFLVGDVSATATQ